MSDPSDPTGTFAAPPATAYVVAPVGDLTTGDVTGTSAEPPATPLVVGPLPGTLRRLRGRRGLRGRGPQRPR